jgi:hypothetical protein
MAARIADAGFIIALDSRDPSERAWARGVMQRWKDPFVTCEGALIEAAHFCPPALVARLLDDGDFAVAFDLAEQVGAVRALLEKYMDPARQTSAASACRRGGTGGRDTEWTGSRGRE